MKHLFNNLFLAVALTTKGQFTMTFTKNTRIVQSWVSLITGGIYSFDKVPNLFNLRQVVGEVLAEQATETAK